MQIVTARIRRMTEGNVFTLSTISGGGCPIPGLGRGVPHPRSGQGVPHLRLEGYPGYPLPYLDLGCGTPHLDLRWGTPLHRPGMGYPPYLRWGNSPNYTEQHSEYLLGGGWCASCVHTGGLSSLNLDLKAVHAVRLRL